MIARLLLTLTLAVALSGCGNSRLNPFNWFGRSEPREVVTDVQTDEDGRPLAAEVLNLVVESLPGGAIVRATARTPTQGWWDAELVPRPVDEDGKLVFDYRVFPPAGRPVVNTPQSREVTAAFYLSNVKLGPVREIVVQGASNARATRR